MSQLICSQTNEMVDPLAWHSPQGHVLEFKDLPPFDATRIVADDFSLWRYRDMLPVKYRFTLGEGLTPLVSTVIDDIPFHAKLDYLNPTGSYKDRGTTVMMNHLFSHGVTEVVEDSSGNAGASVAAFSSACGIRAKIFVPKDGARAKKALIQSFGGELVEIDGAQKARSTAAQEAARTTVYASHAWSPYFVLGQMTVAWEVWEQLGRKAPDAIITPLGHGGYFLGYARGFQALREAGYIDRLPRLFGIQSEGCDPIVRAWESGATTPAPIVPTHTIADGIIVDQPVRGKQVLQAIRDSNGMAVRVNNQQIAEAQRKLMRKGFTAELTSAVTVAGLPEIRKHLNPDAQIIIGLTGNNLKNAGN